MYASELDFVAFLNALPKKPWKKNVISRIVNRAKLTGFVDNSIIKKMMKKSYEK